ncbi:MAG: T9SS type A sorting domain-containing protein [Bacteroidales bacterium]|nr:T9SS type A sorting domain-containing protein [Bacteroidales bacterium]
MKQLRHVFLLLALLVGGKLTAQGNQKDLEQLMRSRGEYFFTLTVSQPSEIQAISDLCSVASTDGKTVVCYANQNEFETLLKLGLQPVLQTPPSLLEKHAMWDGSHREAYDWDAYPTYEAYESMMQAFAAEHPDRCTYLELGTLDSGRKLMLCRINDGQPEGKPKFLYTSTMHGDETTGFMLLLRLIDEFCNSNDDRIVNLINHLDIFICPNTNPDGTYYGGNHTVDGARRKNANNIDLNRHYPDFDKGPHPDGDWCYQHETQWLMDLAQIYHFTMAANYHGGSEVMNYPWDTYPSLHADDAWWKMVCHEYADQCHEWDPNYMNMTHPNAVNGIINGYQWYTISGSRQDYMNYYAQCREVTIECSNSYTPNASLMPMYWNYNHNSMLSYMEQCLNGIHGTITDAVTGEAVEATVSITGHDHHGSEVGSHWPTGDYHRPIKGGAYSVTYSAYGYESQTINVSVSDGQSVTKDVQLVPNGSPLIANFDYDEKTIPTQGEVRFSDKSKGAGILHWQWEFPGGTPSVSSERNPIVEYQTPGNYDVTLTITKANGQSATLTQPNLIQVYEPYFLANGSTSLREGLFYPSGGICGHYGNNENVTATLRPANPHDKLNANFLGFKTEAGLDILSIYDGTTTSAPLIGNYSGTQNPGSITATNAEGALTFHFTTDNRTGLTGWKALLTSIHNEAVGENATESLKAFPNPNPGRFTMEAEGEFSFTLYSSLGQRILSGIGKGTTEIDASQLRQGIYFLQLSGASGNRVEKLVIEK